MPVLADDTVITIIGIMDVSKGCKAENGTFVTARSAHRPRASVQLLQYMRSLLVG